MKKILIFIACFFLLIFLLDRSINFVFEKYIFSKTFSGESGGNTNYLVKKKKDVKFIILGSSRAKNMINPAFITAFNTEGYNAGINGVGGILYMNALVDLILHNNTKPDYIVLQTDERDYRYKKVNSYNAQITPLYPYLNDSKVLQQYAASLGYQEKLKLQFKLYRYNGKFYNIITNYLKKDKNKEKDGYTPLKGTMNKEIDIDTVEIETRLDPLKLAALDNIINVCKENKIKLFIVFPPSYQNGLYKEKNLNNLINVISSRHDVDVINMANVNNLKDLQENINWKDDAHLNYIGSDKFSQYLNDSIKIKLSTIH